MSRDELTALLADLVARNALRADEAAAFISLWDADEADPLDLPAADEESGDGWLVALAVLLLLGGVNANGRIAGPQRLRARDALRRAFEAETTVLARRMAGGLAAGPWLRQLSAAIASYARQMAVAGAGRLPSVATRAAVEAVLARQVDFRRRFATLAAVREAVGRPLSEAALAARTRLYGAAGWGAFFLARGEDAGDGMVEMWVTHDDERVCVNCAPRDGRYFLPGQPPFPGWDCLGQCRCERVPEYNPVIHAELMRRVAV